MTALWNRFRRWLARRRFLACMRSEAAEGFVELLLGLMVLAFLVDHEFRRMIEGFRGEYVIASRDGKVGVHVAFANGHMTIDEHVPAKPNVKVTFSDEKAMMSFLLAENPDLLGSILRQDVVVAGNLNYLYKLAYMARHLQLEATGQA